MLPGAAEFIADLRRLGVPWLVATNNSTMPPAGVAARLTRMGIPATAADVINSSQVAAAYVAREMPGARSSWWARRASGRRWSRPASR